jgi:hypothetical protein
MKREKAGEEEVEMGVEAVEGKSRIYRESKATSKTMRDHSKRA